MSAVIHHEQHINQNLMDYRQHSNQSHWKNDEGRAPVAGEGRREVSFFLPLHDFMIRILPP